MVYIQSPLEAVGWEAKDSMTFTASSPPASLDSQTFRIDISYDNTGPEHNTVLLANTGTNLIYGYANCTPPPRVSTCCVLSRCLLACQVPW